MDVVDCRRRVDIAVDAARDRALHRDSLVTTRSRSFWNDPVSARLPRMRELIR